MPRPGPRPYECIRRAWHSDTHQPLRGALIQEIFRVVNDIHSTSTRRKKEWQEKLPIVVLRAEEILYSKANSESEYADVETLRARLDDAVNTMIRREETEEDGVYLAPCVEAALALGCTPKKIPRGQRPSSSRFLSSASKRTIAANPAGCRNAPGNMAASAAANRGVEGISLPAQHCPGTGMSLPVIRPFPIQEQMSNIHVPSSTMGSSMPSSLSSSPGFATNSGLVPPQNLPFHSTLEVAHSLVASALPEPGGLVQFLRSADAGKSPCLSRSDMAHTPSSQMHFSASLEPRTLPIDAIRTAGTRMDAQFLCRELGPPMNGNPPISSISRLLQEASRTGYAENNSQARQSFSCTGINSTINGAGVCTGINSRSSNDNHGVQPKCHPQTFSMLPPQVGFQRSNQTSFQPSEALKASTVNCVSKPQAKFFDLQLRLAPPGVESPSRDVHSPFTATNGIKDASMLGIKLGSCPVLGINPDTSMPKRMRLEIHSSDVPSRNYHDMHHPIKF